VAIISKSQLVREGLVGLIGQLGDRAMVVDVATRDGRELNADVTIYDLGAVQDLTAHRELRDLLGQGLPVIGLVYDEDLPARSVLAVPQKTAGPVWLMNLAISPKELGDLIEEAILDQPHRRPQTPGKPVLPAGLTERELQVLTLIGQGLSNTEIATELFVSQNTVKTYIRTAYRRIQATSRAQAILWALEHGLVARPVHEHEPDPT
jgi:DNA-binding NarL/FixJ family response regulator